MKNGKAHDPGPMPQPATYCRHCNAPFPPAVPIIGAPPNTQYVQLTAQLADHMQRVHPKEVGPDVRAQVNASIAYSAQRVLSHFDSTDPGLMEWRDKERHRILSEMVRLVSDTTILQKLGEVCKLHEEEYPSEAFFNDLLTLIKSMRDAIDERHLYPEMNAEPAIEVPSLLV